VPRQKTTEELYREVKYQKSWKGSGYRNEIFSEPPSMKPCILDEWTIERVWAPEKSFKKFFFRNFYPLTCQLIRNLFHIPSKLRMSSVLLQKILCLKDIKSYWKHNRRSLKTTLNDRRSTLCNRKNRWCFRSRLSSLRLMHRVSNLVTRRI